AFPVGRRLAFDATKGRLWVVCGRCQRWCLAPLEERWEAIEACEKQFRDARLRASTDEIGLVRLREGLELVRIGAPLLPEFSAWRYGREFSVRRRKAIALGAATAGVAAAGSAAAIASGAGAAIVGLFAMGVPMIHLTGLIGFLAYSAIDSASATTLMVDGRKRTVYRADLRETHLVTTDSAEGWGIRLKHAYGRVVLTGDDAMRATTRLLARANGAGASSTLVRSSVERIAQARSPEAVVRDLAAHSASLADGFTKSRSAFIEAFNRNPFTAGKFDETRNPGSLALLAPPARLALEMALHEESERAALAGELAPLAAAWREAEEVAAISDRLLVPAEVERDLAALRDRRSDTDPPSR
ncbi:MAG TPA: hypothetical protein VE861_08070, partial [Gemmatimonadaceae bacterium]|nr:hypothetical protein [Gemmatimonadaceae bacterium]